MEGPGVSWTNFVREELTIPPKTIPLFLFFERNDFDNRPGVNPTFGDLKVPLKRLLKTFIFLTHTNNGQVFLIYLEPSFIPDQTNVLPLPLRCTFTSDFCLLFLIAEPESDEFQFGSVGDDVVSAFIDMEKDCTKKDILLNPLVRLICSDKGLVSPRQLYTNTDSNSNYFTDLMTMIGPDYKSYRTTSKKLLNKYDGYLLYAQKTPLVPGLRISRDKIVSATNIYFNVYSVDDTQSKVSGEMCLWFCLTKFMSLEKKRPYLNGLKTTGPHPAIELLENIYDCCLDGGTLDVTQYIIFNYNLEDLIDVQDFDIFLKMPLYGYPYLQNKEDQVDTLDEYHRRIIQLGKPPETTFECLTTSSNFSLIYPHLGPIKGLVDELSKQNLASSERTPLDHLQLHIELFSKVLIANASKILINPVRGFYEQIKTIIDCGKGSWVNGFMTTTKELSIVNSGDDITSAPRVFDGYIFKKVLVDGFELKRCVQAIFSLIYIFHNTAPKWKTEKNMLVNYTRGGMGKTHTNNAIRILLKNVPQVFEELSTFTDASFKYGELQTSRVFFMDDVGFSASQQKNLKLEDNVISAQFKCLLDKGFTTNRVTEKSATSKLTSSVHVSVHNCGYIWNTNTVTSFAAAWADRCIVLGNETSSKSITPKGENFLRDTAHTKGYDKLFSKQFLRHHLFQTIIHTLTTEPIVSNNYDDFYKNIISYLKKHYPSNCGSAEGSANRELFKPLDMAVGDSLRLAINTVFDLWIPPWTNIPEFGPEDTSKSYIIKLNRARRLALGYMRPGDLCLEILAQQQVLLPSSFVQMVCMMFNQDTNSPIARLANFLNNVIQSNKVDLTQYKNDLLLFDNPIAVDENIEADRALFYSAKKISLKNPRGGLSRLIGFMRPKDGRGVGELSIEPWIIIELTKLHFHDLIVDLFEELFGLFTEMGEQVNSLGGGDASHSVHYTPRDHVHKNLLMIYSYIDPAIVVGGNGFMIGNSFQGIQMEMLRRKLVSSHGSNIGAQTRLTIPVEYRGADFTAKYHYGCDPDDITQDGATERFLNGTYNSTIIKKFDSTFMEDGMLGAMFSHSRRVLFIEGDKIEVTKSTHHDEKCGWEYDDAAALYGRYLNKPFSGNEMKEHLGRYMVQIKNSDDVYYKHLRTKTRCPPHDFSLYLSHYCITPDCYRKPLLMSTPPTEFSSIGPTDSTTQQRSNLKRHIVSENIIPPKSIRECKDLLKFIRSSEGF